MRPKMKADSIRVKNWGRIKTQARESQQLESLRKMIGRIGMPGYWKRQHLIEKFRVNTEENTHEGGDEHSQLHIPV